MRVFLDIGAHNGLTLDGVADYPGFDLIHSFEPMPEQFAELRQKYGDDPHIQLHEFGLSNIAGEREMYGQNKRHEASVYHGDKAGIIAAKFVTLCQFVDASEWLRDNIPEDATIFAKLNCEGSETDIIQNWIDSGQINRIRHMVVAWDRDYFEGGEEIVKTTKKQLAAAGIYHGERWVTFNDIAPDDVSDYKLALITNWMEHYA